MKVLVIPSWYPNGTDKLMGIYHKEYAYALTKMGIDVDMLFVYRQRLSNPIKYIFMKKREVDIEETYKVYKIMMMDIEKINIKLFVKNYVKKLDKLYKEYINNNSKPDILHAEVTFPAGYAVCVLGKKYNIPVVVTEHSSGFIKYFKGKYEEYGKYVLNNSKYTTVSDLMRKQIKDIKTDVELIPNLVDTESFHKKKEKHKGLNLVTVSAFRVGKGIEYLIEALSILVNKNIDVHLNLIGDGYLMYNYKEIANNFNMNEHITFYGQKTKEEIINILPKNDIFVVPSTYESFCIPGVEALASGLPIVSTKCYGPEEYIDNKCGEFCEIKDPKGLANAIIKVYKNIDKYDINYLRKVADKYSYKKVCSDAIKIYNDLLKTE